MTQEQITVYAREYLNAEYPVKEDGDIVTINAVADDIIDAFLAGAESRQPEIDALTADNERLQKDVAEGLEREEIARKIIEEKRQENYAFKHLLNRVVEVWHTPVPERHKHYAAMMRDVVQDVAIIIGYHKRKENKEFD